MNEVEFKQIMAIGREQSGVEFKCGGTRKDKRLLVRVIRAVISMANRRDGGKVIIGVDEGDNSELLQTGVTDEDLKTWNYDDFADSVAEYTDPSVNFDIQVLPVDGKKFLIIEVSEFEEFPVICKKTYDGVLRSGAIYVRPRRKPESIELPSYVDMQDLLEIAIDKGIRKFIARADRVGLLPSSRDEENRDSENYDNQVEDFLEDRE